MSDAPNYKPEDIQIVPLSDAELASVDLFRAGFKRNLEESAVLARDFARTLVSNVLPDEIAYVIHFCCSYDENPLVKDERVFPEDYGREPVTTSDSELAVTLLWRFGFVPEWINVAVSGEDGARTFVGLECCGRFSAMPGMMYHIRRGRPPFHVLSPTLPPGFEAGHSAKFDLHWFAKPRASNHRTGNDLIR